MADMKTRGQAKAKFRPRMEQTEASLYKLYAAALAADDAKVQSGALSDNGVEWRAVWCVVVVFRLGVTLQTLCRLGGIGIRREPTRQIEPYEPGACCCLVL